MPPTPRYLTSGNYGTPISVRTCGGCALSGWRLRRPVEDLVTIAAKQCEAHARPPDNSAATQWRYGYLCDDLLNALYNPVGDRRITGPSVIGGNLSKIGEGLLRIFDHHSFRSKAKAASTSFRWRRRRSALHRLRPFHRASPRIRRRQRSASISSAIFANSYCRSSGQVGTRSNTAFNLIFGHNVLSVLAGGFLRRLTGRCRPCRGI